MLPVASIYGGNASGKSNFVKALITAKSLVAKGTQIDESLPVEPFLLDQDCLNKPSSFAFVIATQDKLYEYGFKATRNEVVEEWLIEILKTRENEIFRRQQQTMNWHAKFNNEARLQLGF